MTVKTDISCGLIQRPHEAEADRVREWPPIKTQRPAQRVREWPPRERTPHAEQIDRRMQSVNRVLPTLLADHCLVDHIDITASYAEIRLHRRPPDACVGESTMYRDNCGNRELFVRFGGVTLAWPEPIRGGVAK